MTAYTPPHPLVTGGCEGHGAETASRYETARLRPVCV
jgi:hypothetical protein